MAKIEKTGTFDGVDFTLYEDEMGYARVTLDLKDGPVQMFWIGKDYNTYDTMKIIKFGCSLKERASELRHIEFNADTYDWLVEKGVLKW